MGSNNSAATYEDIGSLVPWENNPRKNDHAVAVIMDSIKRFGFASPIVARTEDRMVIAGHTRLKAAIQLGLKTVPVRLLDISRAEAEALALADNRTAEIADWDDEALAAVLVSLQGDGTDLDGLGWSTTDLSALLGTLEPPDPGYTHKIKSPIYTPKGDEPELAELCDEAKTAELEEAIEAADVPDEIKRFLRLAAQRHNVFDYEQVAEYYAHAPAEVQDLMEQSALVIIDFDKAIELGFVKLTSTLADAYEENRATLDAEVSS